MDRHAAVTGNELAVPGRHISAETSRRCRAELSNDLLDEDSALLGRLIDFAFDTLGVQALDVRVTTGIGAHLTISVQGMWQASRL